MQTSPEEPTAPPPEHDDPVEIMAKSIVEQFGELSSLVVQNQISAADGEALTKWQRIGRRIAEMQALRGSH